jgi:hypothetical protein
MKRGGGDNKGGRREIRNEKWRMESSLEEKGRKTIPYKWEEWRKD